MEHSVFTLRAARPEDRDFILRVNRENVEVLAPMDEARLRELADMAELLLIAEADGKAAAFLLAFREGAEGYDSENYRWFCRHYPSFLYVDRVVIDAPFRRLGLGRMLYQAVFEHARTEEIPFVTAEIDTVPYNGVSLAFHESMGFREVGTQYVRDYSVRVSLQEAKA